MKLRQTTLASLISATLLATTLGACGGDSPEKLIASGKEYLAKNDGKAAVIQLKNAIQQNPNLPEARFLLGQRLALDHLQFIQRLRALDQFAVLLRAPGGVAGRQPVVEGIARRR